MPRSQPIKWDEITVLPDSSSALLASGYITRDLLPLIEGQTRQVQAKCHLCDKVFPPIAAIKHNQTSNWLNLENEMGRVEPDLGRAGSGFWACWA
jgi:hypothetical protein